MGCQYLLIAADAINHAAIPMILLTRWKRKVIFGGHAMQVVPIRQALCAPIQFRIRVRSRIFISHLNVGGLRDGTWTLGNTRLARWRSP